MFQQSKIRNKNNFYSRFALDKIMIKIIINVDCFIY